MITRETFIKIMEALQASDEYADKVEAAINPLIEDRTTVNGPICFAEIFCDWKLQDTILSALSKELHDKVDEYCETTIQYFVYELNWGKTWHPGCFTDTNGNDIKLETAGDLYDYLTNNLTINDIKELCEKCGNN